MQKETAVTAGLMICLAVIGGFLIYTLRAKPTSTVTPALTRLVQPPVRLSDPSKGPENAPVTIVVYGDFACDSCSGLATEIENVRQEPAYRDKIRVIWKDFPAHQNTAPKSLTMHIAARCAAAAGKFWEFHDAAFNHTKQIVLGDDVLSQVETESGVPSVRIASCITSPAAAEMVQQNMDDGIRLGIKALPTYFINGVRYEGLTPYLQFRGIIRSDIATYDAAHP